MRILNFGSINIDYVYRVDEFVAPGETKSANSLLINCGGKGLNQSIAAKKAGNTVFHACLLGNDGAMLKEKLVEGGVDVSCMENSPHVSGHAIIEVDASGQNRILLFGGTNQMLTEAQIERTLDAFGAEGLVLLQNETNLVGTIIEKAKKRGLLVALNAAPMNNKVLSYPLDLLDYLIVNEIEGQAIAGCDTVDAVFPTLCSRFPACGILLTLGKHGAMCRLREEAWSIGSARVSAVDTTAAGDTFSGYFLFGELNHLPISETLRLATTASAICVTRPGASDSIPTKAEVDAAIQSGSISVPKAVRL